MAKEPTRQTGGPPDAPRPAEDWATASGWEGAARFRRARDRAMTDAERLQVVEDMIHLAITAGTYRPRKGR
jgi:hypothetical protein